MLAANNEWTIDKKTDNKSNEVVDAAVNFFTNTQTDGTECVKSCKKITTENGMENFESQT